MTFKTFLLAGAVMVSASPALAQTARADQDAASWIDEVVVTGARQGYAAAGSTSATRTDTPLIHVPQSVQVITRSLIEEQDARTLADALVNVSGVRATRQEEALLVTPIIRGFPSEIYLDGLPVHTGPNAANEPTSLLGVDRIEVLKGPTATLYGGGLGTPLGGLINVQSTRPTAEAEATVAVRGGSFSTWGAAIDLNQPFGDRVAGRITAEYQTNESWIDLVEGERIAIQPSLSVQLTGQTELLLQGQYNKRDMLEYSGIPAEQAMAGEIDRNAFAGAPVGQPRTEIENTSATATLRHAFSDDMRLAVTGRYYESEIPQYGSFIMPAFSPPDPATPTVYPILTMNMMSGSEEATFDANLWRRVEALGGRHELLIGASYDHTDFYSNMGFSGLSVGDQGLADPAYDLPFGDPQPLILTQTDRYQTLAVYAQDQATYGRLHLLGAVRYTRLKFRELEQGTDQTYERWSPRVGATFDLVDGVALYAGYAEGFRAPFGFIGMTTPEPEESRNVEGGLKLALSDLGVSGTLALFEQTRDNIATPDPANPFMSVQTGEQRARGFETDLVWEPSPAVSVLFNYAWTDAEVTHDNTTPIGDTLARIPEHSGRIAARYRFLNGPAKGLSLGAGVTAFSERQVTLPNTITVPGYATIDAQAAYDFDRFSIAVSAVNLGGRDAFDPYQYFGFPVVMPTQPRSAFVTLKARF
ncbi:TonB-dependent siderophore receptor [Brevundimonas sp.]|uniref:TonB-dependent siderophore receptor n=1 Tax=Brevundimonas sp. TaxID=1871086 RepID=UPI00356596A3